MAGECIRKCRHHLSQIFDEQRCFARLCFAFGSEYSEPSFTHSFVISWIKLFANLVNHAKHHEPTTERRCFKLTSLCD